MECKRPIPVEYIGENKVNVAPLNPSELPQGKKPK